MRCNKQDTVSIHSSFPKQLIMLLLMLVYVGLFVQACLYFRIKSGEKSY